MGHRLNCQCSSCAQNEYSNTMLERNRQNLGKNNNGTGKNIRNHNPEIDKTFRFDIEAEIKANERAQINSDAEKRANDWTQFVDEDGDVTIQY